MASFIKTSFSFFIVKLNGGRHVQGILRGFDPFMNLVIDECVEMATGGQQNNIGMVVSKDVTFLLDLFFIWNKHQFPSIKVLN
ncbi:PREDICTED: small nuclear ribonucleoprotein G isoform X2 [Myotis davidii]|uniref:small nuclear ribonucleoprotein G isoform X2 n=1 Tax=Myotis davidii TaxID=225400 RepID=UPI00076787C7|nr:PREDICTED: small nuclear ribonucleoprotein G isoform X2 [Myotis davidii]